MISTRKNCKVKGSAREGKRKTTHITPLYDSERLQRKQVDANGEYISKWMRYSLNRAFFTFPSICTVAVDKTITADKSLAK